MTWLGCTGQNFMRQRVFHCEHTFIFIFPVCLEASRRRSIFQQNHKNEN